jgi:hypothetical protein
MRTARALLAATLGVLAPGACRFEDEGLGSASGLGGTTAAASTGGGETTSMPASDASGEAEASSTQPADASSSGTDGAASSGGEPGESGSSGSESGASGSTGTGPVCGNGILEPPEPCDGGEVGVMCSDIDANTRGKPACNPDCTLDMQPCCDVAGQPCSALGDDCCGACVIDGWDLVCD